MGKFQNKPVVIEAITWDEFIDRGRRLGEGCFKPNNMPWSFEINGYAITHENDRCYLIPTLEGIHRMTPKDMLITGVQGEIYPCKLDIFKATYTPVGAHLDIAKHEDHDFSWALVQIKQGSNVARQGWNGKGMFVFLVPGSTFKVNRPPLMGIYPEGTEVNYQAHIDMKTADGSVVPWLASQSDLLAEDWVVVG